MTKPSLITARPFARSSTALLLLAVLPLGVQAEQRCEPQGAPFARSQSLAVRSDGTVIDARGGLQWKRCSEGQSWIAGTCTGQAGRYNQPDGLALAERAEFLDYRDWRLPTLEELRGIVSPSCVGPAIDLTLFPSTPAFAFWSATPFEYFDRLAWAVYFDAGNDGYSPRDYGLFHIRLVRDL